MWLGVVALALGAIRAIVMSPARTPILMRGLAIASWLALLVPGFEALLAFVPFRTLAWGRRL